MASQNGTNGSQTIPPTLPHAYSQQHHGNMQPLSSQDPQYWQSFPQSVRPDGEQDTAKFVYDGQASEAPSLTIRDKKKRTICGLSELIFALIIALIVIAIAAAVGGGIGGGMAANHCRQELKVLRQSVSISQSSTLTRVSESPSPTSTLASPTSHFAIAPSSITVPKTGCPDSNGTLYTSTFGSKSTTFTKICDTVKAGGDMFQISTPSWDSCMDACAQYSNFFADQDSQGSLPTCEGISYVPEWSVHPEYAYSNYSTRGSCWLKNSMDGLPGPWSLLAEVVSSVRK
ncbi:uncharacterized protein BDR25DRAFT_29027 [Lindgomyces ingoldianus]|uniref:Uncharacterized protein n=1 Tax=Lindgomyces ingoldianus TaxID=673940 RepID=A0ACB6QWX4_9PLEO|nr:uncharacterized protein BDR25DRAFT_29027 [Lindgomyces ingoldianus]KAF2471010.1 hypothetical protein BDR25DRAFT_29027 [Lindgomyces ingoldianus]